MKIVNFIGGFDKLDLILYVSKILTMLGNKVLVVDATLVQKSRYIVPNINPAKAYLTRFEDIDIAVGFNSFQDIQVYMNSVEGKITEYDYLLTDIERVDTFANFYNQATIKNYFVTSFETYSIRRGLATIARVPQPIPIKRILFASNPTKQDGDYLEYLSYGYKVAWEEEVINFPYETQNLQAMIEWEKNQKIGIKNLTPQYKSMLEYLIYDIMPEVNSGNLRKVMKTIEREG